MITLSDIIRNRPAYLGTVQYFTEMIGLLSDSEKGWTVDELREHLSGRSFGGYRYINRGIETAEFISLIHIRDNGVTLNESLLRSGDNLGIILARALIEKLRNDDMFIDVFPPSALNYNYREARVDFNRSCMPIKYAPVWNLIEALLSTSLHLESGKAVINFDIRRLFKYSQSERIKISKEQLTKSLQSKVRAGDMAEEFVLQYEVNRLSEHTRRHMIARISEINVSAGYDLVSFSTLDSCDIDRFIEVKSFSGVKSAFYWSENEIATALRLGESYFLYLVNRDLINRSGYEPQIIQNPHTNVLLSEQWIKVPKTLFCYRR
ncbi:MAG: DUF3883 domain-containing protein [Coriobacteriia bacterium]|nr:DUF3883 domain-containing protein [Coriobacteriia bacterium]